MLCASGSRSTIPAALVAARHAIHPHDHRNVVQPQEAVGENILPSGFVLAQREMEKRRSPLV